MRMKHPTTMKALASGAGVTALFGIYRRWHLRWGATGEEVLRIMPGDEIIEHPTFDATSAVTVAARAEDVWPWIVQIGFGRAGWYSYDLLDNLGRGSAEAIIPKLQHIRVGDVVPIGPGGQGQFITGFEPNHWVVWSDRKRATWTWGIYPSETGGTRLVTRVRIRYDWTSPTILFSLLLVEPWDFPMMRKCLLGIKRRAEALARSRKLPTVSTGLERGERVHARR